MDTFFPCNQEYSTKFSTISSFLTAAGGLLRTKFSTRSTDLVYRSRYELDNPKIWPQCAGCIDLIRYTCLGPCLGPSNLNILDMCLRTLRLPLGSCSEPRISNRGHQYPGIDGEWNYRFVLPYCGTFPKQFLI